MAVKMPDPGYTNAGFYENTEGGAAALRTTRNRRS